VVLSKTPGEVKDLTQEVRAAVSRVLELDLYEKQN